MRLDVRTTGLIQGISNRYDMDRPRVGYMWDVSYLSVEIEDQASINGIAYDALWLVNGAIVSRSAYDGSSSRATAVQQFPTDITVGANDALQLALNFASAPTNPPYRLTIGLRGTIKPEEF